MAAGDGLISMTPTSIAYSGTSASINADGGVDFSAVTSLSLNGVFTSDYDNYVMVVRQLATSGHDVIAGQLRVSGTTATGANYVQQALEANNTTITGARVTGQTSWTRMIAMSETNRSGATVFLYGPALAQPTAFRTVQAGGYLSAWFEDTAGTHSLSTSYDGLVLTPASSSITGTVHVFGYEE